MNEFQDTSIEAPTPAEKWERNFAQRALDELFSLASQYKSSQAYRELLDFVARFRFYSPFNAMLVHVQMAGATFVAPSHRWLSDYGRRIKAGARPLVILQPMGPVMFVFDVSDTEPEKDAPPLPRDVVQPFEVMKGKVGNELTKTMENAKRDGVNITEREAGSQSAGVISMAQSGKYLQFQTKSKPRPEHVSVPLRYGLLVNSKLSAEAKYATLVHELAHLYCGHLGTPNITWWPDRRGLHHKTCEFEAESVCYLVCKRLGIDNPSEEYLSWHMKKSNETPSMSLDCVMKAAGLIEQMGRVRMKPRKEKEK